MYFLFCFVFFPSPLFLLLFQSGYVLPGASLFDLRLQKQTKPFKPNVKGYGEEGRVSEVWAKVKYRFLQQKKALNWTGLQEKLICLFFSCHNFSLKHDFCQLLRVDCCINIYTVKLTLQSYHVMQHLWCHNWFPWWWEKGEEVGEPSYQWHDSCFGSCRNAPWKPILSFRVLTVSLRWLCNKWQGRWEENVSLWRGRCLVPKHNLTITIKKSSKRIHKHASAKITIKNIKSENKLRNRSFPQISMTYPNSSYLICHLAECPHGTIPHHWPSSEWLLL